MDLSPSDSLRTPFAGTRSEVFTDDRGTFGGRVVCPFLCYVISTAACTGCVLCTTYFYEFKRIGMHMDRPAWRYVFVWQTLAVVSAASASANSLQHCLQHCLYNENHLALRKCVMPILLVVPVYAVLSASAFVAEANASRVSILLDATREFYEAIVLVSFMNFVAAFWGGAKKLAHKVDSAELVLGHVFPALSKKLNHMFGCCIRRCEPYEGALMDLRVLPMPRAPGSEFVAWSFVGVLQYAVIMLVVMGLNFGLWAMMQRGAISAELAENVAMGVKIVKGVSNLWAMWNLLVLYEYLIESPVTKLRMIHIKPLHKFVCIKLIVLFSLWQEVLLKALSKKGLLPIMHGAEGDWTDQEAVADGVVNLLVCIEMLFFAQWHRFAYPYTERWDDEQTEDVSTALPVELRNVHVCKMVDDIGYLLRNRVRRQHKVYALMTEDVLDIAALKDNFNYFELDGNREASLAQLQFGLKQSGLANWHDARDLLRAKDLDCTGRLSFEEFVEVAQALQATKQSKDTKLCRATSA